MTDFSMLDKDHPERVHPTETDLDEARENLRKWRETYGLERQLNQPMQVSGHSHESLVTMMQLGRSMPEGEGFCPRCLMPLTQCNCKERGV